MRNGATPCPLVWISKRYAVNPANVTTVFRGTHGELEIAFVAGAPIRFFENELTSDGVTLFFPAEGPTPSLQLEPSR